MPERFHSIEIDPHLLRAFAETFISHWDRYPLQTASGSYVQIQEKLILSHIFKHLTNARLGYKPFTIGAYALDEQSRARWICFNAVTPEQWNELRRLAHSVAKADVNAYLEPTLNGGHLWMFTPVMPGGDVRRFARKILAANEIAEYDANKRRRIEIYPKQDYLTDGAGSFVRLPLGVDQKSGRVHSFVDIDGHPLAPTIRDQMRFLAEAVRVPHAYIAAILAQDIELPSVPPKPTPKFKKRKPRPDEPLSESLKHMISVFEFVSQYVTFNEQGRGFCPFHDDRVKSFAVNQNHNYWHCFSGCGGGSIIDFWMKWRAKQGQDAGFAATIKELRSMLLTR